MIIRRKAAPPPTTHALPLGRGVVLHARPLDSYTQDAIAADVNADLDAIIAGDEAPTPPLNDWNIPADLVVRMRAGATDVRRVVFGTMLRVARAAASVDRIEGVVEEDETPAQPSHDFFVWLFKDAGFEGQFGMRVVKLDQLWAEEGKDLGREQNGSGAAASTSAQAAAPISLPAPAEDQSSPTTAISEPSGDSAPSSPENLEQPQAPSPGASPPAPAVS